MLQGRTMFPSIISFMPVLVSLTHRFPPIAAVLVAIALAFSGPLAPTASAQTQIAKLLASDGAPVDYFGHSVSLRGNTALIGAMFDDDRHYNSGSAYVFTLTNDVWIQLAKLTPRDGLEDDFFGGSVSVSGDTAVIGAWGDDDNGDKSGSAYVFTRTAGIWTQQAKLLPSDGVVEGYFGWSVSVDGDTAVIGAWGDDDNGPYSGSAYVFTRINGTWTRQAKLLPSDGEAQDYFAQSVSVHGDTVVIGARGHDDNGSQSGSAYVFIRGDGVWTQQAELLPSDAEEDDWFGESVSINDDTAVIGAIWDDDNAEHAGSAYVFTRIDGVWIQQAKLLPSDGAAGDYFGISVSVNDDTALVGAKYDDDNGYQSGSVYAFTRSTGVWSQQAKLLPSDGASDDDFGISVSISGHTAVIGAWGDDDKGIVAGSAYVFDLTPCPADFNADGIVTSDDYDAFASAFESAHPTADFNADGFVNGDDFDAFASSFESGC